VYLYCIGHATQLTDKRVQSLQATPADGIDTPFRVIKHGDLAALVSDTDVLHYDIQRDSLMAHHHVLEEAMKLGDILPISYGTVATSDEDIVHTLLKGSADELHENLEHIHGRVELSLRVMWQQEQLFQEIVRDSAEIGQLRDAIAGVPEDRTYHERIRLGELTSHAIVQKSEAERDEMLSVLIPLSADVRMNPHTSDTLIIDASFLVDRDREPEFDEAVQSIAEPRQERMTFRYLGPLPATSFVSVVIQASE
jgi:hypothetical protein